MSKATFRDYKRLLRGANQFLQLLRCDCINGYAIGRKRVENKFTRDLAVTVYVNKKLSLRRLPLVNRIPKTLRIPDDRAPGGVLDFITDVQEARFNSLEFTQRVRPAQSGISIGHVDITAGTLGGLVRDRETNNVVILSNNHVMANSNDAVPGDTILQPGPADGGVDPDDQIAMLTRFVEIDFAEGAENRVDGAIATPVNSADVIWNTRDIGPEVPREKRNLGDTDIGDFVHKSGRTTEHTQGFVQAVFATVQVKYDLFKKATFIDQIICSQAPAEEDFSAPGDSGSLVYDSQNRCIGLLFAGSESSDGEPARTIVNPIGAVLRELNVSLLASGDHPSADAATQKATRKKAAARKKPTRKKAKRKRTARKKATRKKAVRKKAVRKKVTRKPRRRR